MSYFNIIDSLNDVKVNEGMTESIPKNKNNDIDKLVKALQSCDIDFIPDKYIKCYKSFYNRSSFSKNFVDNVIKWTGMLKNKSNNGSKLYMLCLGDGGRFLRHRGFQDYQGVLFLRYQMKLLWNLFLNLRMMGK